LATGVLLVATDVASTALETRRGEHFPIHMMSLKLARAQQVEGHLSV
jgi:hypothetical protein